VGITTTPCSVVNRRETSTYSPGHRVSLRLGKVAFRRIVPVVGSTVLLRNVSSPVWPEVGWEEGAA